MARTSKHVFFLQVCSFIGFVPWINFDKNEVSNKKFAKFASTCSVIFKHLLNLYVVSNNKTFFLRVSTTVQAFLMHSAYIRSIWFKRKQWNNLIQLFHSTDILLEKSFKSSLNVGWTPIVIFLIYILLVVGCRVAVHLNQPFTLALAGDYGNITTTTVAYLSCVLMTILSKGLKIVREATECLPLKGHIHFSNENNNNVMICRKLYENLYEMSELLEGLFSWLWIYQFVFTLTVTCIYEQTAIEFILKNEWNASLTVFYGMRLSSDLVSGTF